MNAGRSASSATEPALKRVSLPLPNFVEKVTRDSRGRRRKYVVYVPPGYRADRPWPAILYLHGFGERGTDGRKQCSIGISPAIMEYGRPFPFIVMFPQSVEFDRTDDDLAMTILDKTRGEYRIDPDRIYLTGLSMGGAGTWRLATRHPDRFAAIAPVCGRSLPGLAANLRHTPVWCFHGDADPVIPVAESRRMIRALKALGLRPKYSEYSGVLHNSWDRAYGTPGLYSWLLRHRRVRRPRAISYHFDPRLLTVPHDAWWVRIDDVDRGRAHACLEASLVRGGRVAVFTRGVRRLTITLDEDCPRPPAGMPRSR